MIIIAIALALFLGLVSVTLAGGRVRRVLTAEQLSAESREAMKLALGLVATMTAILLGLLISSAKTAFDITRSEVIQMAAKLALLDRVHFIRKCGGNASKTRLSGNTVKVTGQRSHLYALLPLV